MIDLLILYFLSKKVCTMYGIHKQLKKDFSALMEPSFGTISPALNRMAKLGYLQKQKTMSKGGRPSVYYSITSEGRKALSEMMLGEIQENPYHFIINARVRVYCADVLEDNELIEMVKMLKLKTEILYNDTLKLTEKNEKEFFPKLIFDNLTCEYKNFMSLLEGIERACKR